MASDKWDVNGALAAVVRAIQDGSSLSITGLEDGYKRRLNRDFADHWNDDDDKYSWPKAQERVLKLAELVGSLATALTIYKAIQKHTPIPQAVDPTSAYIAGSIVAKVVCPDGVWCMHYDDYKELGAPTLPPEFVKMFKECLKKVEKLLSLDQSTGGSK